MSDFFETFPRTKKHANFNKSKKQKANEKIQSKIH